ncbi:hypothetical protein [Halocatena marina]|uniref:hypothetical protein n=1 Tax=Halocatena marina TaxID=2934937 RepID=UPI002224B33A|nr:hypothetical protein [Halocatena marina]
MVEVRFWYTGIGDVFPPESIEIRPEILDNERVLEWDAGVGVWYLSECWIDLFDCLIDEVTAKEEPLRDLSPPLTWS